MPVSAPAQIEVISQIRIGLLPNGEIICEATVPNLAVAIMMFEKAKLDFYRKWTTSPPVPASPIEQPGNFDPSKVPPLSGLRTAG